MTSYMVTVSGDPVTQGSMKGFFIAGHVVMVHQKEKELMTYRDAIKQAFVDTTASPGPYFPGHIPVFVAITAWLEKPKSAPKSREFPSVKGADVDKLARACLDAMTGTVYDDDSQVVRLLCSKRYDTRDGHPSTCIFVTDDWQDFAKSLRGEPVWTIKKS